MNWTRESVLSEVREVIELHSDDGKRIEERTELVADLGIDSLGVMEVVAELEDRFGLHISDADLREVVTLGDVADAVFAKLERDGRARRSTEEAR
ncbi:MAG: acyl carrier protein [Deltaproteobacteria bacterium]|nr:acyl carrier protein [Deltaproteobacteria bacterium]